MPGHVGYTCKVSRVCTQQQHDGEGHAPAQGRQHLRQVLRPHLQTKGEAKPKSISSDFFHCPLLTVHMVRNTWRKGRRLRRRGGRGWLGRLRRGTGRGWQVTSLSGLARDMRSSACRRGGEDEGRDGAAGPGVQLLLPQDRGDCWHRSRLHYLLVICNYFTIGMFKMFYHSFKVKFKILDWATLRNHFLCNLCPTLVKNPLHWQLCSARGWRSPGE